MTLALKTARTSVLHVAFACTIIGLVNARAQAQSGIRIHMHGKDGYAADGLLYVPTGQGPFAAILLIPDERGLTRRISDSAQSFADAGYLVVAVDLNRGLPEGDATRFEEHVRMDLDAALAFLGGQSNVRQNSVGAMGWGSGGIGALRLAADAKLTAVVIESLPLAQDLPPLQAMHTPVLGIFSAHDGNAGAQSIKALERRLRILDKSVTIKVFSGAARGFDDPDDAIHYLPEASADARRISLEFFATQLRAPHVN